MLANHLDEVEISRLNPLAFPLLSLLLAVFLCLALSPIACRLGWVNKPDWRKQHAGEIPLVGSPAIFLAVLGELAWRGGWLQSIHVLA